MIRLLTIIIFGIIIVACTVLMHDKDNPCTGDSVECNKWKKNFPGEYKNYKHRIKKYKI